VDIQRISNNNIYHDKEDYKDKSCTGSICKNTDTHLYQISLILGSSFLCNNCKSSIENIGCILNIKPDNYLDAGKENFKGRFKSTLDDHAKRRKKSSNSRRSSMTL
jgi:hypothetical protein